MNQRPPVDGFPPGSQANTGFLTFTIQTKIFEREYHARRESLPWVTALR